MDEHDPILEAADASIERWRSRFEPSGWDLAERSDRRTDRYHTELVFDLGLDGVHV
jgi:hypothetical protein